MRETRPSGSAGGGTELNRSSLPRSEVVCARPIVNYDARMPIRVEFYGIARQRAGLPAMELEVPGAMLGSVLNALAAKLPEFGRECVSAGQLAASLTANLDGKRFISDPATPIRDGQSLLILSADAGG